MKTNELLRNIWIEFSLSRALLSPGILFAIFLLTSYNPYLAQQTNIIVIVLLLVWGNKQAADSITSEINDNTWISQKMSRISALDMTIGKLFGSTIYSWYTAFITILISSAVISYKGQTPLDFNFMLFVFLSAVIGHAATITLVLLSLQRSDQQSKKNRSFFALVGIITSAILLSSSRFNVFNETGWYGFKFNTINFTICTYLLILFFVTLSLYRNFRVELQYKNGPFVWIFFLVTTILYFNGIWLPFNKYISSAFTREPGNNLENLLFITYMVLAMCTYVTLLIEPFSPLFLRKILVYLKQRRFKTLFMKLPVWHLSFIFLFLTSILITIYFSISDVSGRLLLLNPLSTILFLTRDFFILTSIRASKSIRPNFYIISYILGIYFLFPVLLGLSKLEGLLLPWTTNSLTTTNYMIISPLIQALLAFAYFYKNRKKILGVEMD